MHALDTWNPEAGFFHTATKDVRFWPAREAVRQARAQARRVPMPEPIKRYRGARAIACPGRPRGRLPTLLLARRTWRRFSAKVPEAPGTGDTAWHCPWGCSSGSEASPGSCRSRRRPRAAPGIPSNATWSRARCQGCGAGIYHYDGRPARARACSAAGTRERLASYYPASGYFAGARHVFLTAVFARQLWRYPYSRAYRAALAEAGHVCQTFCLTATWLAGAILPHGPGRQPASSRTWVSTG